LPEAERRARDRSRLYERRLESKATLDAMAPADRMRFVAQCAVAGKKKAGKCAACWLMPEHCICPIAPLTSAHRFGVFMHYKGA
jgi:hypothetical protein